MENILQNIKSYAFDVGPKLLYSFFVFMLFYSAANFISNLIYTEDVDGIIVFGEYNPSKRTHLAVYQLKQLVFYTILSIGIFYTFINLGFQSTTFLTLLGVISLAIGLSLQDSLCSITSGIYLSSLSLFEIGDKIDFTVIDSASSYKGVVVDFNLFFTTLKDQNGRFVKIPNNKIQSNIIVNDFK